MRASTLPPSSTVTILLSELVHLVTDFAFPDDSSISFDSPTFNVSESTVLGNVIFSVTAVSGVCGVTGIFGNDSQNSPKPHNMQVAMRTTQSKRMKIFFFIDYLSL